MDALAELASLLRPRGGGLYLVSSGRSAQLEVQRRLYAASSDDEVERRFRESLERVRKARAFVLGIPSDTGAGFVRGANLGPQAIRLAMLEDAPRFFARADDAGVVDVGDVFCVPQLLHDEMLSDAQLERTRAAVYGHLPEDERGRLPVSPLSVAERAIELLLQVNPRLCPVLLGGDHSCAWPAMTPLHRAREERWGVVQVDAHTDLLAERLGVTHCFATWSFHANELLGRGGRLVQVGVRASAHDRGHWEETLDVRQVWADACRDDPDAALDRVIACLHEAGVERVYLSNDIDGTDEAFADATGTPEAGGLHPDFVVKLIRRVGAEVGLCGGDVMEVAPSVRRRVDSSERTLAVATRYLRETVRALVGERL